MDFPVNKSFEAFALIADINGFTKMVREGDDLVGQFTRDILVGGVNAVESANGEVVAFMGDAFLALLPTASHVIEACIRIATDIDAQCEYISNRQQENPELWAHAPGGPSMKIAVEFGWLETVEIESRCLGTQSLIVGEAINIASRISAAGRGNRCLIGPEAERRIRTSDFAVDLDGPRTFRGKKPGGPFTYFELDLGEYWVAGPRSKRRESYLG